MTHRKLTNTRADRVSENRRNRPRRMPPFSDQVNRASSAIYKLSDVGHRPRLPNKRNRWPGSGSVSRPREIAHRPRCPILEKSRIYRDFDISESSPIERHACHPIEIANRSGFPTLSTSRTGRVSVISEIVLREAVPFPAHEIARLPRFPKLGVAHLSCSQVGGITPGARPRLTLGKIASGEAPEIAKSRDACISPNNRIRLPANGSVSRPSEIAPPKNPKSIESRRRPRLPNKRNRPARTSPTVRTPADRNCEPAPMSKIIEIARLPRFQIREIAPSQRPSSSVR